MLHCCFLFEIENGNLIEGVKWAKHTMKVNKNVPASTVNLAKIYYEIGDNDVTLHFLYKETLDTVNMILSEQYLFAYVST